MDLLTTLRTSLKEKRVRLPLAPEGYLRGSGLSGLCPREEILVAAAQTVRTESNNADDLLTFAHGHGLHFALQNHVLPHVGVLVGRWLCLTCGTFYGTPREPSPLRVEEGVEPPVLEGVLVRRPEKCAQCGEPDFIYRELHFACPEYGTGGHPDGFLVLDDRPGLGILEAKSIANLWEVREAPHIEHLIQVQTYLWFTGLKWALILYWHKGGTGLSALVRHYVERDEETITQIKQALRAVWDGLQGAPLPARICQKGDAPRAKACTASKTCFELPDHVVPEPPAEPPEEPDDLDPPPEFLPCLVEAHAGDLF